MTQPEIKQKIINDLNAHRINPMNDVLFKFIFGKEERKHITIDFLNAVLEDSLAYPITELNFTQTEFVPQDDSGKLTRFDVACKLDSGEVVDVEVQVINYQNMQRRTLYYWSQMYLMGIVSGEDYAELRPAITINILAFNLFSQSEPHAMFSIYNIKTGERLNRDMELHFLEIPKFKHKPVKQMNRMERWLAYFSNRLNQQEREELAMSETAISNAYDATSTFFLSPQERLNYINRQMAIMDYNSGINAAKKQGEARLSSLMQCLHKAGRDEDAFKAAADEQYRQKLYKEFAL
jgi:predicted transposase/invertase (TIGR01784 family)